LTEKGALEEENAKKGKALAIAEERQAELKRAQREEF